MTTEREPPSAPWLSGARPHLAAGLGTSLLGLVVIVVGFVVDAPRTFLAYLTAFSAFTAIGLGALAFLLIVHAMGAKWPLVIRRQTEALATSLFLMAILFVPIAFGLDDLYLWARAQEVDLPHHVAIVLEKKQAYLDERFFLIRTVIYFALWLVPLLLLLSWSGRISTEENPTALKTRMRLLSSAFLPFVGIGLTFAAFDWMMSLHPEWYSSIFGIYYFASGILPAIAVVTIVTERLDRAGPLARRVNTSHYYALGRLLFAFVVFWAYITFFQFFIIWMVNRPESVAWYVARVASPWGALAIFLVFAHFVIPFALLLPYRMKRRSRFLSLIAGWILIVHYLHVHWIVVPSAPDALPLHWVDFGALLLFAGAVFALVTWRLQAQPLLPVGDPDLLRALEYRSV
jgi:hypothetical protein